MTGFNDHLIGVHEFPALSDLDVRGNSYSHDCKQIQAIFHHVAVNKFF
jgi:hypothetical protein